MVNKNVLFVVVVVVVLQCCILKHNIVIQKHINKLSLQLKKIPKLLGDLIYIK